MTWFLSKLDKRKLRLKPQRSRTALRFENLEDRTTPTITITGTPGDDTVTSRYFFDTDANQYRGEISLNGAVVSSFLSQLWPHPYPKMSIYLPEPLSVDTLGGNDTIDLSAFRDPSYQSDPNLIHGGDGNDTIIGTDGHDIIYGDAGADWIDGGLEGDQLFGDANDTALHGGDGYDVLTFESFAGTMRYSNYALTLNNSKCDCTNFWVLNVTGSSGNDTFDLGEFQANVVNISTGAGSDTITTNSQLGVIDGGDGDDTIVSIYNNRGPTQILGGAGNDKITVSSATTVYGGPGNDILDARNLVVNGFNTPGVAMYGEDGNDTIYGSPVGDYLYGGNGTDTIFGGNGNDLLSGDEGSDTAWGEGGDDIINGDISDAGWYGGTGTDRVSILVPVNKAVVANNHIKLGNNRIDSSGIDVVEIFGTATNNKFDASKFSGYVYFVGGDGDDTLRAGCGGSSLVGGNGNDILIGGSGPDFLYGGSGSDQLTGNDGDDKLYGETNDTTLSAGAGNDYLFIGGESTFVTITNSLLTVNGKNYFNFGAEEIELFGSNGDDSLNASTYTGNISFQAKDGNDIIVTGSGNDYIFGDSGDDTISTGAGNNYVVGGIGADSIITGDGDDVLVADANDLVFNAGMGNNELQFFDASGTILIENTQISINGNIRPTGTLARISIVSLDTNDTIDASAFSGFTGIYDQGGVNTIKTGQGGSEVMSNSLDNTVYGGNGNDNLIGVNGPYINAGAGDDQISARFAYTTVIAGDGNDRVVLSTMSGNVSITDTYKNDNGLIVTFSGIERLETGTDATDDIIDASAFKGYLVLFDAGGSNTIYVGSGGSTIYLGYSNLPNIVYGGAGDDFINASSGAAATIFGGDGNDTIYGSFTYGDWLDGGAGDDTITGYGGADTIIGGDGNDTLIGDYGPNTYPTTLNADLIEGGNGNDTIFADGTGPATRVYGGDGDDFIRGGNSTHIEGGNGNDMITCDFGTDQSNGVVFGGEGDDIIMAMGGVKVVDGGGGNDTITAGQFDCVIHGGDGDDNIVTGSGNNIIYGDNGNDVINAGVGNDQIYGGDGDDQLVGNYGDDWLDGGAGVDQINGGVGADTFVKDADPAVYIIESQNWDFNPGDGDVVI